MMQAGLGGPYKHETPRLVWTNITKLEGNSGVNLDEDVFTL